MNDGPRVRVRPFAPDDTRRVGLHVMGREL